ncbi:hypothetical protein HN51_016637 [Arachis hypogaea]
MTVIVGSWRRWLLERWCVELSRLREKEKHYKPTRKREEEKRVAPSRWCCPVASMAEKKEEFSLRFGAKETERWLEGVRGRRRRSVLAPSCSVVAVAVNWGQGRHRRTLFQSPLGFFVAAIDSAAAGRSRKGRGGRRQTRRHQLQLLPKSGQIHCSKVEVPKDSALLCISAALFSEYLLHCKLIIRHNLIVLFLNPFTQFVAAIILREYYGSGETKKVSWRESQLKGLRRFLIEKEDILKALMLDLGKHKVEAFRDEAKLPQIALLSSVEIVHEPLSLVLIISSWNFLFGLSLEPLIGAVTAENTVVLKPSELSPACSSILALGLPNHKEETDSSVLENEESKLHLQITAELLMCDPSALEDALCKRVMITPEEVIKRSLDPLGAMVSRDGLAKTLYSSLFDWLVQKINVSIGQDPKSKCLIGVLDIYGFESFKNNR